MSFIPLVVTQFVEQRVSLQSCWTWCIFKEHLAACWFSIGMTMSSFLFVSSRDVCAIVYQTCSTGKHCASGSCPITDSLRNFLGPRQAHSSGQRVTAELLLSLTAPWHLLLFEFLKKDRVGGMRLWGQCAALCSHSCNTGEECSSDVFPEWVIPELPEVVGTHCPVMSSGWPLFPP